MKMKRALLNSCRRIRIRFIPTFLIFIGLWIFLIGDRKPYEGNTSKEEPMAFHLPENAFENTIKSTIKSKPHLQCSSCNHVLIVGYFRGGSTMTLDVLSQSSNSFYAFEPINFLSFDTYEKANISFLNGTSRLLDEETELPEAQAEMLFNWFNCKFEDINISDLVSSNLLHHSKVTTPYYRCQQRNGITKCLNRLLNACKPTTNRILKVVRLRVKTLELLLEQLPGLKIIYLIRDPRGIIHSLRKTGLISEESIKNESEKLCKRHMAEDLPNAFDLKRKYPQNMYTVKYETIVSDPLIVFKYLFNFTKLPYSLLVEKFIKSHLMRSSGRGHGHFITKSGDAQLIASDWRRTIGEGQLGIIDRACADVYRSIGYLQTDLRTIRNTNISIQTSPNMYELFDIPEYF